MLDFRLKVFQSVAVNLSFTKAAHQLYITQPAITRHIRELELEFETKLFHRTGNRVSLTEAGKILLSYAEQISTLHNEAKIDISRLQGSPGGELRLGASTTVAQYVIPGALAKFSERFPKTRLSLVNGNSEQIEQLLLKNKINIGIVEGKPANTDLRYAPFLDDELVIFTALKNKAVGPKVSRQDFAALPLVLRERGSGTLEIIEKCLKQAGINPKDLHVLMYLGSTEAIKGFIKTGIGTGIVSRFAIEQELLQQVFKLVLVPGLKFPRQFYFISPKGTSSKGLVQSFMTFMQNHYNLLL